jgi:hypothetical protein
MDSRAASRGESGLSSPRAASGPNSRSVCRDGRDACDGREVHPPCWHDGTERPIHRPTDPADQQDDYSGKQKGPTIKTRLVIDATCPIGCLSATSDGKAQETSLAEREGSTLPHGSGLDQAMGFQGVILNGITSVQPKKNPRGGHSPHRSK